MGRSALAFVLAAFAMACTSTGTHDIKNERVVGPADREEIRELISLYSHALDAGNLAGWTRLFTEDAGIETANVGSPKGRAALLQWAEERVASRNPEWQVRHFVFNTLISPISADLVYARSMLLYTRQDVGKPLSAEVLLTGVYEDEIRRTPEGWQFARRKMELALPLDSRYVRAGK